MFKPNCNIKSEQNEPSIVKKDLKDHENFKGPFLRYTKKPETLLCNTSCVMAPKSQSKASSSKGEASAPKRPLSKDLTDQLPPSTSEKPKGQFLFQGLQIVEGLIDKNSSIKDAKSAYIVWELFFGWFRNINMGIIVGNPWNCDLGNLIVPNVHMDVDLLKAMATNYDVVTRTIRTYDGKEMVRITKDEIAHVFKLTRWSDEMPKINEKTLTEEYDNTKIAFRVHILPRYLAKSGGQRIAIGKYDKEPFPISYFVSYFQKTFYSICQIIGYDPVTGMPMAWMYMKAHIQHPQYCIVYDYVGFLVERIHKGLIRLKKGEDGVRFIRYSLLMHMFLFKGAPYLGQSITLDRKEGNLDFPMQCWTIILDKDDKTYDYVTFQNFFALELKRTLVVNIPRIPIALHDFMRPKERRPKLWVDHNWGDVIPYPDYTILRVYGSTVVPHQLPKYVPKRIGFLEVIWQLGRVENEHMLNQGKGTFFPLYTCFFWFCDDKRRLE